MLDKELDKRNKVLVISHGHPDINPGGGEIAAYNLFNELNQSSEFESVFFARHQDESRLHGGTTFSGTTKEHEILFFAPMSDWFKFSQPDKPKVWRDFRETLELTKPDVVHFHHYVHLGLELIREVKNYAPNLPIVMTLHEYFGICHNHGQMVKTHNNALCSKSSPADCASCFPEKTAQDFFLRKQFIQSYFELVDEFISPSEFLRQRYIDWGIPAEKIRVIENIDMTPVVETAESRVDNNVVRFSFFGQINWFKGIDVLLDAFKILPKNIKKKVVIDINGSGLEHQHKDLQNYVERSIAKSGGKIRFRGRYQPSELAGLMHSTDWVIIPSKWWENAPMVITEASKYSVPVMCSNIGGMAEKVEHDVTGLHFQARNADSLAAQMIWAVNNPEARMKFIENIQSRYCQNEALEQHYSLYNDCLQSSPALAVVKAA